MYITYLTEKNAQTVCDFAKEHKVKTVYIREDTQPESIYTLINGGVKVKFTATQNLIKEVVENGKFIGYQYKGVLLTSYKTDIDSVSPLLLSTYDIVRAYTDGKNTSARWALNFASKKEEELLSANGDTLLIDCKTFAIKRL
jgi:hypothetical protein